ncbi:MAG TPA: tripartite tricarboxylate transporter TctB family protein [Usitatibacter sp.]|nr:tripartite tricarboxylate transporter TctB family protein [Usitatibacter sp.]
MRRMDVVVGAVALAACALAFGLTFKFSTTTPAAMMSGMGAEFFPRLVIAVMALLALGIMFGIGNPPMEKPERVPGVVWVTLAILGAYIAALEILGMWIASLVLMLVLGRMWGERSLVKLGIAAVALLAVLYFVFIRFLKGGFPEGLIARLWS